MKKYRIILVALLAVILTSCGGSSKDNDIDKEKPTVTIIAPTTTTTVVAGKNIVVKFTAKDNVGVSNYTLKIVYAGTKYGIKTVEEFSFDSKVGKTASGEALPTIQNGKPISFSLATPENIAKEGQYKLTLTVSDKVGNITSKEVKFTIQKA